MISIWDAWTRLFHWSFAGAVLFMLFSGLTGVLFFEGHKLVGELVLALVVFRVLYGLVGPSNVRLLSLITDPRAALRHLGELVRRQLPPERGHNAAGSWAVLAMLLLVGVQAVSGLFIADEDEFMEGALYSSVSTSLNDVMYTVHHINSDLLKAIVAVHIVMVALYLLYAGVNLIKPMITGKMAWPENTTVPSYRPAAIWVGAVCVGLALLGVAAVTGWFN